MKNRFFRLCSTILVLALLVNMLPTSIFAEAFEEQLTMQDSVSLEPIASEKAYVVEELTNKRTEYTKEFLLSNGLHVATVYAEPVHYQKDGKWAEIDNTLIAKSDGTYRNTAGVWNVSFPNQLSKNSSISIEKDGYTLSFNMAGELRSSGELMTAAVGTEATEQLAVNQLQAATAAIQEIDTATLAQSYQYEEAVPDKLYSQLRYNNVYANTDVIYDLESNTVKESIVIDSYSSTLRGYRYTLNVGQLIPVIDEYNDITFYSPDGKTVVMVMPAPYLLDANNQYNDEIQVQLTGQDGTYTLTYLLPRQWMAEEERAWPVILDPVIKAARDDSIADRTVCEKQSISKDKTIIDAGYSAKRGKIRAFVKYTNLPELTSSDVVLEATFKLIKVETNSVSKTVEVHQVTSDWEEDDLEAWDDQPLFDPEISDFARVKNAGLYKWMVTEIVRSWYTTGNFGLMIKMSDDVENGSTDYYRQFYSSETGNSNRPILEITFKNNNGLESYWDYTSTSAGRAGTGYVNNFTGNLVWVRNDLSFSNSRGAVSIEHVYNLNDAVIPDGDTNNSNDSGGNYFGLGIGWRTNYHQRVFRWTIGTTDKGYYIWEDGDGTDHYFKLKNGTYEDEDNLQLKLYVDDNGYRIVDKEDNTRYFDSSGRLIKIENNQAGKTSIVITYRSATSNQISTVAQVSEVGELTADKEFSKLSEVNKVYNFDYGDDILLDRIDYVGSGNDPLIYVIFSYDDFNQLRSVTYPDGEVCYYEYADCLDNGILKSATDIDGYKVTYGYTNEISVPSEAQPSYRNAPYFVESICESYPDGETGEISGGSLEFTYGYNETRIVDHNDNVQILQFNDYGNITAVMDDEGHAQSARYTANSHTDTAKANQLTLSSNLQNTVANLLNHSSFETGNPWTAVGSGASCTVSTAQKHYGAKSLLVKGIAYAPSFTVPDKAVYTLSAYVRATEVAAIGFIVNGEKDSSTEIPVGTGFVRYEVSYINKTGSDVQVTPFLSSGLSIGAYFDGVQLENMPTASRYNLVENGDFRYTGDDGVWTKHSNCTADDTYVTLADTNPAAPQLGNTVFSVTGNYAKTKNIKQTVAVSGEAGDSFVFAGWVSGYAVPQDAYDTYDRKFTLRARFEYQDGSSSSYFYADFQPTIDGWQYASQEMVATKAYSGITVMFVYDYNVNTILIDGIQLFKEAYGTAYEYDEDTGDVIAVVDPQKRTISYDYDDDTGDLLKVLENGDEKITYTYNDWHNVTSMTTAKGLCYEYDYNPYGNSTETRVNDNGVTISSQVHYTADGTLVDYEVDSLGNTTRYGYNPDDTLLWVQRPNDGDGTGNSIDNRTMYAYDNMLRIESKTSNISNGVQMSAAYTYDGDFLQSIATPTTTYSFSYGVFGLRENIQAGSNTLATYNYTKDGNFNLKSLDYGNGDSVEYEYDTKGRPIKDTYEDGDTVEYLYDNNGDLAKVIDSATGRTTTYYYDFVHQQLKYEVVGEDHFHSVSYEYDKTDDLLDKQTEVINGTTTTTTYTYDTDNRVETVTVNGVTVIYSYNNYGNISQKVTKIGTNTYKTETFTYTSANGGYSSQVATHRIVSGSMDTTYSYTYDANGNIASVSDGTNTTSYEYDSANQLVRENNQEKNFTHTWEYDNAGNILNRKEYPYTTGTLTSTPDTPTVTYGYPTVPIVEEGEQNPVWGDLLSSVNGATVSYDGVGNPTSGYGWMYEWEHGRQLKKLYSDVYEMTYEYNADGMRTKRTDGTTTYEYTYNGSQLTQMKVGNNIYRFTYDAGGTPLTFSKNGVVYYYLTNLQGDVIEILDSSGNTVGAYTYDAWGVCSRIIADPIESENPLRYRGYVYDQETGLYYLQSRYYDPEVGRFLNADVFYSTGQGFVGNNMFAYCGNNPVVNYDPSGYCFHRLDFWHDCEKCGGKTITEKLKNNNFVVSSGHYASLNVGVFNITGTIECAVDLKGNIQLFSTVGYDFTSSPGFSVSGGSTDTMLFAPDTSALYGESDYAGGGVTCPIPNTLIAGSSMDNIFQTSDGYWGTNSTTGISFPAASDIGGEIHKGYSFTYKLTKQYNIFNGLDKIVAWYTS